MSLLVSAVGMISTGLVERESEGSQRDATATQNGPRKDFDDSTHTEIGGM